MSELTQKTYSITELAELMRVDRSTIWRWIKSGLISGGRTGPNSRSPYRISSDEVERLLKLRTPAPTSS